jgi:UDP-sulfoquinovose synthase
MNQFVETFSVNQLAEQVRLVGESMGLDVTIKPIPNPRKEPEQHYYNPAHTALLDLGLKPHYLTDEVVEQMLRTVLRYRDLIDTKKILPRVRWNS